MRKMILNNSQKKYIRHQRFNKSAKAMARQIGCSPSTIIRFMKKENITLPKDLMYKIFCKAHFGRTSFTKEEDQFIRENYLKFPIKTLGNKMGRSYTGVMNRIKAMNLDLPYEVRLKNLQSSRYQKGQLSFNKGKKQSEYISPEGIRKSSETRFKKGHIPLNTKSDGFITIRHTKNRRGDPPYKYIRLSKSRWMPLHQYNWEKKYGKPKPGYCLRFKDGNTLNCKLSNLELINRAENMRRNSIHNYPAEIRQAIHSLEGFNRKLKKIIKNENNQ